MQQLFMLYGDDDMKLIICSIELSGKEEVLCRDCVLFLHNLSLYIIIRSEGDCLRSRLYVCTVLLGQKVFEWCCKSYIYQQ